MLLCLNSKNSKLQLDYLRKETNEAYEKGLYLSVMFLSRKTIETITIRVMEVVFPKIVHSKYNASNHELWFDTGKNGYRNFGELLENIKSNSLAFHEDKQLIEELYKCVKPFKKETNACVHSDYKVPDAAYIREWRVQYIVNLARKIFKKYCNP